MKYLLKFNEDVSDESELDMLKQFCDENLVSLIDEGYDFYFDETELNGVKIFLSNNDRQKFKWSDVKDEFLQFLEMLISKYNVYDDEIYFNMYYDKNVRADVNDLLENEDSSKLRNLGVNRLDWKWIENIIFIVNEKKT